MIRRLWGGPTPSFLALSLAGRVLNVLGILILAACLSLRDFGTLAFFQATVNFTVTLLGLNAPVIINVLLAKGQQDRRPLENSAVLLGSGLLAVASGLVVTVVIGLTAGHTGETSSVSLLLFAFSMGTCVQPLVQAALFARGEPFWASGSNTATAALQCAGFALARPSTLSAALVIMLASLAAGLAIGSTRTFRAGFLTDRAIVLSSGFRFIRRRGLSLLRFSALTLASGFAFQGALWFIQYRLLTTAGAEQNAPFALGVQFYNVIIFLPSVFSPILLRRFTVSSSEAAKGREVMLLTLALGAASLLAYAAFDLLGPTVIGFLPKRYGMAEPTIAWGVIAGLVLALKFPLSVFFQSRLVAAPEAAATFASAALIFLGALLPFWSSSSVRAMELRSIGHFAQFGVIVVFFLLARRSVSKPSAPPRSVPAVAAALAPEPERQAR